MPLLPFACRDVLRDGRGAGLRQPAENVGRPEVAKKYKVSDVAIHKVCKSLEIPTPSQGYWAKLRAGKPVAKTPLPQSTKTAKKIGAQTGYTPPFETNQNVLEFLGDEERAVVMAVASQILLPDENERMHSKIIAHRKVIAEWKKARKPQCQ